MSVHRAVTVLVADDDAAIRTVLGEAFRQEGWRVEEAHTAEELMRLARSGVGDVAISDVIMPGGNGLDMLPRLQAERPDLPVIVMSAHNTLSTAMTASTKGAFDYLAKPFDIDAMIAVVGKALGSRAGGSQGVEDAEPAPGHIDTQSASEALAQSENNILVGRSQPMQALYKAMARVVNTDLTVMIGGESGTGKELVARALHMHGPRRDHPFVPVNLAALPRELIESELFGHERGAFTGAQARTLGRFGQARGGTLFLDEIGDMPLEAQTRLLRVLQEGEYHTVGGQVAQSANVRVIAATNKNLQDAVKAGLFREDLFFRLNVVPLTLPPLRERQDDIPDLARHFMSRNAAVGLSEKRLSRGATNVLSAFHWPGNVRELENFLYRVCALYPGEEITGDAVRQELERSYPEGSGGTGTDHGTPVIAAGASLAESMRLHLDHYFDQHEDQMPPSGLYQTILQEVERPLIEKTLAVCKGNQVKASALLGLNRNTLRKKIRDLDVPLPRRR
ncbi:nitrogen regulation protein NR(I) [Yunchengibacter salinarum]|uniref:nitrogen regulation protein NR(I) n=1 Tax=Yunchengibacter salinarum TaxID=3133399 RepID=UPI0035B5C005